MSRVLTAAAAAVGLAALAGFNRDCKRPEEVVETEVGAVAALGEEESVTEERSVSVREGLAGAVPTVPRAEWDAGVGAAAVRVSAGRVLKDAVTALDDEEVDGVRQCVAASPTGEGDDVGNGIPLACVGMDGMEG